MENYSVYEDIANRTGGDIYIGVVGPVRTGKSTFIKRFMETLVIPNADAEQRAVMIDELPQAAAGKTVMTTEPKFVPAKAAKITIAKGTDAHVRLVDCVGFSVVGASGFEEDGAPRLVKTPWQDTPMPFEQAAEIGTEKVIREHSTIGILVTTDGSVTDIPRENYTAAEERAVAELKRMEKPFVILLNCQDPSSQIPLQKSLEEKYGVPVYALNAEIMSETEIVELLKKALFEFPVTRIDVQIPTWLRSFEEDNAMVAELMTAIAAKTDSIEKMRDCFDLEDLFLNSEHFINPDEIRMDLGTGRVEISVSASEGLFYRMLSETSGEPIENDLSLMQYVRYVSGIKSRFEKVQTALDEAEKDGYGIVYPTDNDYRLEKPQLIKKGGDYGVQFKAGAASYHIVKVDITGEVDPVIGTKQQSEEFVAETTKHYDDGMENVWETNIFGKTLRTLVGEELSGKNAAMPAELRKKMRRAVTRIVNEGKGNVICILF